MNERDEEKLIELVSDALSYWKAPVSEFALKVWVEACKPYTLEQVSKAIQAHAVDPERGQFAPKVADIVRQLSGTVTDQAAIAWGKALDAAARVGAYQDVCFDDPIIHSVITDLGGWPAFCRSDTDELGYLQHRFTDGYRAYTAKQAPHPAKLTGDRSPDSEYEKKGLQLPKPVLVGDAQKAEQVLISGATLGKTPIHFNIQSLRMLQ